MIIGVGNDIIEIERVRKACEKEAFLAYSYTEKEIELFKGKASSLAGNFCAKEAFVKALGIGFREGIELKDIEVLRNELGAPYINVYGKAKKTCVALGVVKIHVSISNLKDIASSVVILEK